MMKKLTLLIISVLLCLAFVLPTFASMPHLRDDAGLLSATDAAVLEAKLDTLSEAAGFDIVVITVDDYVGYDVEDASVIYYNEGGYGTDGVILLLSMAERDYMFTSFGETQKGINSDAIDDVLKENVVPFLSSGDYARAFDTFAEEAYRLDSLAKEGKPYKSPFSFAMVIIAFVISIIVAAIVTSVLKGKLKSVHMQRAASSYVRENSMNVYDARDRFLYVTVSRTAKPTSSSKSSSSSGTSHTSGGGKF